MRVEQRRWTADAGWLPVSGTDLGDDAQLVLLFGATGVLDRSQNLEEIRAAFPRAVFMGCSTAGEIHDTVRQLAEPDLRPGQVEQRGDRAACRFGGGPHALHGAGLLLGRAVGGVDASDVHAGADQLVHAVDGGRADRADQLRVPPGARFGVGHADILDAAPWPSAE